MNVMKDVTVAGKTIFVRLSNKRKKRIPGEKREDRKQASPEKIEKINQKNAERILAILINYNFQPGDYHIVLTYSGEEPSKEQAKKDLEKFKRQLMKLYKQKGIIMKWITATEYENTRIHHHIVLTGGIDLLEITKIWAHGFIRPVHLDDTGDYRRLASYLIKETSTSFRKADAVSRRRYNCSRSIVRPMVSEDEVSAAQIKDLKPVAGYYIDQDSIYHGENPITGRPYVEYIMVSLTEIPRITVWNRGKKKTLRGEYYKVNKDQQVEIDFEQLALDTREAG
jgi:hypothetical protein